jgi:hypothetical protein
LGNLTSGWDAIIVLLVSIKLLSLLRPSLDRITGSLCGLAAAWLAGWLLAVASGNLGVEPVVGAASIPLAIGIGWLLGPAAAAHDRWKAAGAAIAAAFLGTLLGAFVVGGLWAASVTHSLPEAVLYTLGLGVVGYLFGVVPMMLAALPIAALWVVLVQATSRVVAAVSRPPSVVAEPPMIRRRVPRKLARRRVPRPA